MRGFGAVQACFAYESQMDKLALALGLDPAEVRVRNALHTGGTRPTGQVVDGPAPVVELLRRIARAPRPPVSGAGPRDRPGGGANTAHREGVGGGGGYPVSIKTSGFPRGLND